ncbi:hypothetical protein MRX96_016862 [Rhipicephalus microplus]
MRGAINEKEAVVALVRRCQEADQPPREGETLPREAQGARGQNAADKRGKCPEQVLETAARHAFPTRRPAGVNQVRSEAARAIPPHDVGQN